MNTSLMNPYTLLGLNQGASAEEARKAYLNLVRQYPPDQDAEKFREIHDAYQRLNDPLLQAEEIVNSREGKPNLGEVITLAEQNRPRLSRLNLLALGNQE